MLDRLGKMAAVHARSTGGLLTLALMATSILTACGSSTGGAASSSGAVTSDVSTISGGGESADVTSNPDAAKATKVIPDGLGLSCAGVGQPACPAGLDCYGDIETPRAICTWVCNDDSECPASYACVQETKADKICRPRAFCSACTSDEQCGPGGRCINMGQGDVKYCSHECGKNTGCPRYADCKDYEDGTKVCMHNAGTCEGDGSLCAPCIGSSGVDACQNGGSCLTYMHTKESFCSASCTNSCEAGYACTDVGSPSGKQCVPDSKENPKCVPSIHATMEVGDIFQDFETVGYIDTDGDGSLLTLADGSPEQPQRLKFSEYVGLGGFKVVVFVVSAGWCGPCQQETLTFKSLLKTHPDVGIFQVLYDGPTQGSKPTLSLAKSWIKKLNGVGAVGVDVERNSMPINTAGSVPLNMVIDASTFKILKKINGAPPSGMASFVAPYLK